MAEREPAPATARKLLVLQTAFLGDQVLATSFLVNLRRLEPDAEIRYLTTPVGARLLQANEQRILPVPYDKRGRDRGFSGFLRLVREFRRFAPDRVFCLHRSIRSVLLAKAAGGESFGFSDAAGAALLEHLVERRPGAFEAEKNHALLEAAYGERARGLPLFPVLHFSPDERREAERLLEGRKDFLAIAPGSVWATKRWPAASFAQLIRLLGEKHGLSCVLVGGSDAEDLSTAAAVLSEFAAADPWRPLSLAGRTGLGALKAVLARARLAVTNDSAPLHVAIAVGTPVVAVFGPTTRELGFFPLTVPGRSAVVERAGLACRPCGLHGHKACPLDHFRCMREIEAGQVLGAVERLLCP